MTEMLECGCKIEKRKFIVGVHCKMSGCEECNLMPKIHPFGTGKLIQ